MASKARTRCDLNVMIAHERETVSWEGGKRIERGSEVQLVGVVISGVVYQIAEVDISVGG